jgi:hypothetical protein
MNIGKEFKKFATKHHGVNSMYYDKIVSGMTPYIIEERQMNIFPARVQLMWFFQFFEMKKSEVFFFVCGWFFCY